MITSISGDKKRGARVIGTLPLINIHISVDVPFYSYKLTPESPCRPARALISSKHLDPKKALELALGQEVGIF